MKKYKYIHILYSDDLKFNPKVIKLVNNKNNRFDVDEHLFVTAHKRVYDNINEYSNVEYVNVKNPFGAEVINRYAKKGDWFIVHSLPRPIECLKINPKLFGKIVWRTWGHDTGYNLVKGEYFKNFIKYIINHLYKFEVKKFKAIGISNTVDAINISTKFGNMKMFQLSYPERDRSEIISKVKETYCKKTDTVNILLGHSGYPNDNHRKILDLLKAYLNQNMCIYIVLSYGNEDYILSIKQYANENFNGKVKIIENFMPYEDFVNLIADMDIGIIDGIGSYALGNIGLLKYFEKKIYINEEGVIRKAFDLENIPYGLTKDIGSISFEEFRKPFEYKIPVISYEEFVKNWHNLLNYLDQGKED